MTGEPQITDTSYVSENISVSVQKYDVNNVVYYVADVYLRDISCLRRAFVQDSCGKDLTEPIADVAARMNAVLTVSGDCCSMRDAGVVEANGTLYLNSDIYNDICVLYRDGSMDYFSRTEFDCDREIQNGAYQIWNFGPALLAHNPGLTQAYNPDGGRTAKMYMNGNMVNTPAEGGRNCSDYICVADDVVR